MISISIIEDNTGTRDSLATLLNQTPNLKCLATYGTAEEALTSLPANAPDVALVDINLPGMNGIQCISRLRTLAPNTRVLILTRFEESDLIFEALRAGASGYLLKKSIPSELLPAIEQVHAGGAPMSMPIARQVVDFFHQQKRTPAESNSDMEKLTPREQEILSLLAKGCLYKEISDQLNITLDTVRAHIKHVYDKLHVRSRTEATLKFLGR